MLRHALSVVLLLTAGCDRSVDLPALPIVDLHTHCQELPCDPSPAERSLEGRLTAAVLSVEHYDIATTLGDEVPPELAFVTTQNEDMLSLATSSDALLPFASLDCLHDLPASQPDWTERCLADADAWLARGIVGFKDHAGKAWDGAGFDMALWVGSYNRLAGWCSVDATSTTPNRDCQEQPTMRWPIDQPEWRAMVAGLVEDRAVPLVTHAVSFHEADTVCHRNGVAGSCFELGADALVDFALWAQDTLTPEARQRIVVAHLGFLQDDPRLEQILDTGVSVDLTQTSLTQAGCQLRELVARYPDQVVLGTDVEVGLDCLPQHYDAWAWALLGPAGTERTFRNTCRGTLNPIGADLATIEACDIALPEGTAERVTSGNAERILGR